MIEFKNVSKIYNGEVVAVDNASLTIKDGEFICFIGTSGSGKTTALRLINRMHDPTKGEILIDEEPIKNYNPVNLRRKIGYVIQQTGLLPHMTVYENIVIVPRLLKWEEQECRKTAERLMERVDLPLEMLDRYPSELSGGQQQRIGVIRALAANPGIVLMDEPFGALDPITRDALHDLVIELQQEYNNTFIFVTHDMDEALKLADRIAIWHHGELVQYDTPENILANPANSYVADFVGTERLFHAKTDNMKIKEVMREDVLSIRPGKTVADAVSFMHKKRIDTLFIVDDHDTLMGRLLIEDIAKEKDKFRNVTEIMEKSFRTLRGDSLIQNQIRKALEAGATTIPVVDKENKLTGIITRTTLVNLVYNIIWNQDNAEEEILEEEMRE